MNDPRVAGIQDIELFVEVVEAGSLSAAAQRLARIDRPAPRRG